MKYSFTICTPTYNRAHLLPRLYKSLCRQTFKDFEWLIVDDGSTDDTEGVITSFVVEQKISIRYFKQTNGGKLRAVNRGSAEAKGLLMMIADSDDWLPDNSLEVAWKYYQQVKDDATFGGVCGLDAYEDGRIVGYGLPQQTIDCSCIDLRFRYRITGDMKEVILTSVMRQFPFPEIEGETFCPEALVWNRIGQKYIIRYFNHVIYCAEYQPDGLSAKIRMLRHRAPQASALYYSELYAMPIPLIQRIKAAINYWRFALGHHNVISIKSTGYLALPFGAIYNILDKCR